MVLKNRVLKNRVFKNRVLKNRVLKNNDPIDRRVSALQKKMVASQQEWKCNHCRVLLDYTYEIDHIVPLYKGGSNTTSNLQALCRNCHGKKTLSETFN